MNKRDMALFRKVLRDRPMERDIIRGQVEAGHLASFVASRRYRKEHGRIYDRDVFVCLEDYNLAVAQLVLLGEL